MDENTIDPASGLEIRKTDNGLRECDVESPQINRILTSDEIAELIAKGGEQNGDR